ncbi:probable rhamnogalacturonate lyase B [Mangifera indica]|uniref:probable rhamnogalacturonate lyase B n=1 Tax=Mangifera indica TaxID=29780 RepID=UPI001CFB747C|nr:probable rhamnogalacturonate lyase B [Mangifera indica]
MAKKPVKLINEASSVSVWLQKPVFLFFYFMSSHLIFVLQVILDNGLVRLTVSKPQGYVTSIKYGGLDNLLDRELSESGRGYWDINWNLPGGQDRYKLLSGAEYGVIRTNNDCVEVSFKSSYNPSTPGGNKFPLTVDIRYVLRIGVSGFHCYSIYERPPGWPAFDLAQTRMVFKLRRDWFHYMAITDEKQRVMPMPEDLLPGRGKQLIVPESVLLVNPINPDLKGEVDDKYQYSMDNKDGGVHGWISSRRPMVGFWVIFPSQEFRNGGPTKQNLTVHTGPACLAMFHGTHYIGDDILAHFQEGETWRKVFGPIFVYLNSTPDVSNAHNLWIDAKKQRLLEEAAWPYDFVSSPYYVTAKERGSATGRLFVQDRFVSSNLIPAKNAYIGLSSARTEGAWQTESKDYQFWVQTDSNGNFTIKNVVPGVYGLHGWVSGFIGDYLYNELVTISAGSQTELGNLTYVPLRDGQTLWEIGFPDRTATGFFVPDVNLMYVNKLFVNSPEMYRQYGLWDRYTDVHPQSDQVFTIGINDPKKDWFFAHIDRRGPKKKHLPSTWTIKFYLASVISGIYKVRLSIASATRSDLKVYINYIDNGHLAFEEMNLGMDNTVCRHGIHGLYRLFSFDVSSVLLIKGDNSMFLTQARGGDPLCGVLYDYIRLEAPASSVNQSG